MSDDPDDDVQSWFDGLSYKVKRKLAATIKEQADGLADAIKAAAPVVSGRLRDSVQVRRTRDTLDFEVTAGGDMTTVGYNRSTGYSREVAIGQGDTAGIAKQAGGADVSYDYALATEFGTTKEGAEPFFFPTFRARQAQIREAIEDAVNEAVNS